MKNFWAGFASLAILMSAVALIAGAQASSTTHSTTHHATHASTAVHRSLMNPASLNQKAPDTYKAKFTTTQGDFVVEVTRAWAPLGADRFYNLVKNGFFTDASFFRVISGFMVQFGLSAKPPIAAVWSRAPIPDDPVTQSNKRGYVTFATAGPNTRTTQIFINFGDNSRLDGDGFAPFGQVVEGMDVVDKLHSGYGEGAPQGSGPDQSQIEAKGKAYLDAEFPKLDSIKSAVIVAPAPVTMTKKPAAASTHKAAPKPQ
ncbi:MAG TPA: peptidylprolyl isomerase [Terriglobia bacterium]|nr:peptidylprolyl isomerase [Terriglobia bacterium]